MSDDEYSDIETSIQKLTDKYIAQVEKAVEAKTKRDHDCINNKKCGGRLSFRQPSLLHRRHNMQKKLTVNC